MKAILTFQSQLSKKQSQKMTQLFNSRACFPLLQRYNSCHIMFGKEILTDACIKIQMAWLEDAISLPNVILELIHGYKFSWITDLIKKKYIQN
jgi:hypothetical protein